LKLKENKEELEVDEVEEVEDPQEDGMENNNTLKCIKIWSQSKTKPPAKTFSQEVFLYI
jgi:hypothetical protein